MIFQKIGGIIISVNMMCGLEIHVQLETESKLFCDCPTNYKEAPANSNICPVCLNQPGAKPYPTNEKAIENDIDFIKPDFL